MGFQRFNQIALKELNPITRSVTFGVGSSYFQSGGRQINGNDAGSRDVYSDGYCNASRARSDIDDQRRWHRVIHQLDYSLNQEFGFGSGNEHGRSDAEV